MGEADNTDDRLVFNLDFLEANSQPTIEGGVKDDAVVNYFIGNNSENWYANVPTYRELVYRDIYPNIDLRLYGDGGMLRYDFVVNPGATPEAIALAYNGIDSLAIVDGELVMGTALGDIVQSHPYIYQCLHLLYEWATSEDNSVVINSGYLPPESPLKIAKEKGELFKNGHKIVVQAEVEQIELSGHADQKDLVHVVETLKPDRTFLVHGEYEQAQALSEEISNITDVSIPTRKERFTI